MIVLKKFPENEDRKSSRIRANNTVIFNDRFLDKRPVHQVEEAFDIQEKVSNSFLI